MRVVVELVSGKSVRGWAFNGNNIKERLKVQTWVNGQLHGETFADIFRQDLLDNNFGDGYYGFEQSVNSDFYLDVPGVKVKVEIRGLLETGEVVATDILDTAFAAVKTRIALPELAHETPSLFGDGFFSDNVRSFNNVLDLDPDVYPVAESGKEIHVIRMFGFGDFQWWTGPDGKGPHSAARFVAHIGPQTKERLANGHLKLLFDMSNEGPLARPNAPWLAMLHQELHDRGISPSGCIMVNHNTLYKADYLAWCEESGETEPMDVLCYDYFLARLAYEADQRAPEPLAIETTLEPGGEYRAYVCLNFTPRQDRISILAWLFGAGLADKGFISFAGFVNLKLDGSAFELPDWFPEGDTATAGVELLRAVGRLTLDEPEAIGGYKREFDFGPEHCFRKSFFSIVTESEFSGGEVRRITEKSLKPLAMGHPLIVVGNAYSLRRLRELGFRTFSPFIDESYDECEDRTERMRRIQKEVRRLAEMSHAELLDWRLSLRRVIEHNYRHARGGLADHYRSVIEPGFLQALDELPWGLTAS